MQLQHAMLCGNKKTALYFVQGGFVLFRMLNGISTLCSFRRGHDSLLYFFKSADFNLTDTLTADAEFGR